MARLHSIRSYKRGTLALTMIAFCLSSPVESTTLITYPWEDIVLDADFIGIVECSEAGETVTKFRVIETWKGSPNSDEILVDISRADCPILRYDSIYLIAATDAGLAVDNGLPLWWRRLPADYELSPIQGISNLTADDRLFFQSIIHESEFNSIAEFRMAVSKIVSRTPEYRELARLQAYSREHRVRCPMPDSPADTVAGYLDFLFACADTFQKQPLAEVLASGGGAKTETYLLNRSNLSPLTDTEVKWVLDALERRKHPEQFYPPVPQPEDYSEVDLSEASAILELGADSVGFWQAFRALTVLDPQRVALYLSELPATTNDKQAYSLGSSFAYRCTQHRATMFQILLSAEHHMIRAVGAIYLSFENPEAGIGELRAVSSSPGVPGAWAALNLLRRGDARAMPRALEVFAEIGDGDRDYLRDMLQTRLEILISNSCKASELPMPDIVRGRFSAPEESLQANLAWWNSVKNDFILYDPWFEELAAQKID